MQYIIQETLNPNVFISLSTLYIAAKRLLVSVNTSQKDVTPPPNRAIPDLIQAMTSSKRNAHSRDSKFRILVGYPGLS